MGRTPKELCICLVGSEQTTEAEFRQVLKRAASAAQILDLVVADVEIRRADVAAMIMTATVSGVAAKSSKVCKENAGNRTANGEAEAAYHIIMTGYAGVEGTLELYRELPPPRI